MKTMSMKEPNNATIMVWRLVRPVKAHRGERNIHHPDERVRYADKTKSPVQVFIPVLSICYYAFIQHP